MELMTGKPKVHCDLINSLQECSSLSNAERTVELGEMSRETVLEQALVEQNQIFDVMQELISTLEFENKHSRNTIIKQGSIISGWGENSKHDEVELEEYRSKSKSLSLKRVDLQTDLKKKLSEKDKMVVSLRSRYQHENMSLLVAKFTSIKTKLRLERAHCIELEEELSQMKVKITKLNAESNRQESMMVEKESEMVKLKHEIKSLKNFEQQQQDLVMKQHNTLLNKDVQLGSLTRALDKERKVADQLKRIMSGSRGSPGVVSEVEDSSQVSEVQDALQASLFEQLAGRSTYSVELMRNIPDTELGFSFTKVNLPICRIPCLIVMAVKDGSLADGILREGDKLLEVNRILCQSLQQWKAVHELEKGMGVLKIVVARTFHYPDETNMVICKTPIKDVLSNVSMSTTAWAPTLHNPNITIQSYSCDSDVFTQSHNGEVTDPESGGSALALMKDSSGNQNINMTSTSIPLQPQEPGEKQCLSTPSSFSNFNECESLIAASYSNEVSAKKLQYDIVHLQDQLEESEKVRLNLESLLNDTHKELDDIKNDNEAIKSENEEFQLQLLSRDSEINDIQQYISELQSALVALQSGVSDDQQKIVTLENQNKFISDELAEVKSSLSLEPMMKENLEEMVLELNSDLERRDKNESEMGRVPQKQTLENTQLSQDALHMESKFQKSISTLDNTSTQAREEKIADVKKEFQQMEFIESSDKTQMSAQEQYEYLNYQLESTKTLLMEAEVKDSQVQVEVRCLKQAADQANDQLKIAEEEYHKTLEELRYFKQEAEGRTLEVESMKVGLKGAQIKLEGKQEMTMRIQTEIDSLRRTNAKLRNEAAHLRVFVKEAELDLKASSLEEERLGKKLQASMMEQNELFEQLEKSFEESTELSVKVRELEAELKEFKKKDIKNSKNTMEELMNSSRCSEARLQGEFELHHKKALIQKSSRKKTGGTTFQNQCETGRNELKQEESEKEHMLAGESKLRKDLAEMQGQHTDLNHQLDSKEQEMNQMKFTVRQLQEQLREDQDHSSIHISRILELESELEEVQLAKERTNSFAASLESTQKQDQEKLEEADKVVQDKEKNIRQLSMQIDYANTLLQKSELEQLALTTFAGNMKQQLKESQQVHSEEIKNLKEEIFLKEKLITRISDELESYQSKSKVNDSKVEHLVESVQNLTQERDLLNETVENSRSETAELRNLNQQLHEQVDLLKAKLEDTLRSSNEINSESADLRQQLQQNDQKINQLTAQLHAAETDLEIALKNIHEIKRVNTEQAQEIECLKTLCDKSHSLNEDITEKLENTSLELCKRDEEISKLKTSLQLSHQDSITYQDSLVTLKNNVDNERKKFQELNTEQCALILTISELRDEKKVAQESFKKEITAEKALQKSKSERYQADIETLRQREKEYINTLKRLNVDNQELGKSRREYSSIQEDMKRSICKIESESTIEIIKLKEEVRTLNQKYDGAEKQCNSEIENKKILKGQVLELEHIVADLEKQVRKEKLCNKNLQSVIKVHQATAQGIQELNEKVSRLNENLREKSKRLSRLEETHKSTVIELRDMKREKKVLLENASGLTILKPPIIDQAESTRGVKMNLIDKKASYEQILRERDCAIRELEFLKHLSKNSKQPLPISATTAFKDNSIKEKEELLTIIQQKEDEVKRARKYTEQLLISVMIKAPSLLEK